MMIGSVTCSISFYVTSYRRFPSKMQFPPPFSLPDGVISMLIWSVLMLIFICSGVDLVNASRVCGWISAPLWRGVKELDLAFVRESDNIPVLSTALLFTVKTLVRLKLEFPFLMTVPVRVCLPSLMTLELHRIKFEDDDSFKRLISSCPVLEQLSISCCDMRSITCLKISNHSLKSLTLVLNWYTPDSQLFSLLGTVFDLPCLVYFKYVAVLEKNNSMGNMLSLVVADTNISVGGFVGETIYHQPGLVGILEGIGNVKSLHMSICPEVVSFPVKKVPSCVVNQLKEFKVIDFDNVRSLFKMVIYILNNATLLHKLREELKITKRLLRLPSRSIKC
ncbi:hypothetical protein V6N11_004820 [Hibiscus sabdariffa]|uniref:FBD domain-containing protein n=1 Tax=Hibiscus sabdariffa TaxID=183260 RepID=A0ABR2SHN8_9ROSI